MVHKSWLIIFLLIIIENILQQEKLSKFVDKIMSKREKYIVMKKNVDVAALPEFKNVFLHSKHV